MNERIDAIIEKSYNFNIYFGAENGNIGVNIQFINELQ